MRVVLLLFFMVFSCESDDCGLPNYEKKRECGLTLNQKAKKSLNTISLLSGQTLRTKEVVDTQGNKTHGEYITDIYFDIQDNTQMFYIEKVQYDFYTQKLKAVTSWEIPLNELNPDNIEISEFHSDFFVGDVADLGFRANMNNPNAFKMKFIVYDENGNPKVTKCEKRDYFEITTSPKIANELKTSFQGFLNNIN